jgi:hypothetical protein
MICAGSALPMLFKSSKPLLSLAPASFKLPSSFDLAAFDLAPKFYPILSSLRLLDFPIWAVVAAGAGAEPSA